MTPNVSPLPPPPVPQIDLSDDVIVGQLFGSGAWQDVMEGLQVGGGRGGQWCLAGHDGGVAGGRR